MRLTFPFLILLELPSLAGICVMNGISERVTHDRATPPPSLWRTLVRAWTLLASIAGVTLVGGGSAVAQGGVISVNRETHIRVSDAGTGAPVEGAAILSSHSSAMGVTGASGLASFVHYLPPDGDEVTFQVQSRGHAPIVVRDLLDEDNMQLFVTLPMIGQHLSPLVEAAVGGTFELMGQVDGNQFYMEVEVPGGAMPFDGYLDITPFSPLATAWKGLANDVEEYQLGYFHLALRDAQGKLLPDANLGADIRVTIFPWMTTPSASGAFVTDSTLVVPRSYDSAAGEVLPSGSSATIDPVTSMVAWDVESTGLNGVGISIPQGQEQVWLGSTDPSDAGVVGILNWLYGGYVDPSASPKSEVEIGIQKSKLCLPNTSCLVNCGRTTANTVMSINAGFSLSISTSLIAKLQAELSLGVDGIVEWLASAGLTGNSDYHVNAAGGITFETKVDIPIGSPLGTQVAHDCCQGTLQNYQLNAVSTFMVAGVGLGSISVPEGGAQQVEAEFSPNCHYQVGDEWKDCLEIVTWASSCSSDSRPESCTSGP
ncbi:hypothetical protein [Engelhardtia mirabilis]|uniref:Uncharacterized protein n=1 Tax=Engelhardtia mirabilis TaxID=2528011 RepID=A0A518BRU3_9BACT|nr:hypothetical protein Pla133_48120 [Planctomycetes bacterium Pla133]QDV04017.1 hypothetical protein Pla86_48100 [Planctomycetes bacterium Pla86]